MEPAIFVSLSSFLHFIFTFFYFSFPLSLFSLSPFSLSPFPLFSFSLFPFFPYFSCIFSFFFLFFFLFFFCFRVLPLASSSFSLPQACHHPLPYYCTFLSLRSIESWEIRDIWIQWPGRYGRNCTAEHHFCHGDTSPLPPPDLSQCPGTDSIPSHIGHQQCLQIWLHRRMEWKVWNSSWNDGAVGTDFGRVHLDQAKKILKEGGKKPENQIWLSSPFGYASSAGVQQPELYPGLLRWTQGILSGRLDAQKWKSCNSCDFLQKQIAKREGAAILVTSDCRLGELSSSHGFGVQCPAGAVQTHPVCCGPSNGIFCAIALWSRQQSKAFEQQIFQTSSSAWAGFGRTQLLTLREFYPAPCQL